MNVLILTRSHAHPLQFDEYISGALSCVKYSDFLNKGQGTGVVITDGAGK